MNLSKKMTTQEKIINKFLIWNNNLNTISEWDWEEYAKEMQKELHNFSQLSYQEIQILNNLNEKNIWIQPK